MGITVAWARELIAWLLPVFDCFVLFCFAFTMVVALRVTMKWLYLTSDRVEACPSLQLCLFLSDQPYRSKFRRQERVGGDNCGGGPRAGEMAQW